MKVYPNNSHLTCEQKRFNYRLSKAKVVVEHGYGRLKGMWRCLLKRLDVDISDVPRVVSFITSVKFTEKNLATSGLRVKLARIAQVQQPPQDSAVSIRDALKSHFTD